MLAVGTTTDPTPVLLQYGLVGLVAIVGLTLTRYFYRKLEGQYIERLRDAESREAEARKLLAESQDYIRSQLLPALKEAAVAAADAAGAQVRARRRDQ